MGLEDEHESSAVITFTEDMDRIVIDDAKQPFRVVLREPSTSGFVWQLESDEHLSVISNRLTANRRSVGGVARRSFVLQGKDTLPNRIAFRLVRPWESTAVRSKVFDVLAAAPS